MKTLVAYFSLIGETEIDYKVVEIKKGHTEIVAEKIASITGADLYKIEPVDKYPFHYSDIVKRVRVEEDANTLVAIEKPLESIDDYDVIYIGFPIWYRTYPRIINTFLKSYSFKGKVVKPFCTNDEGFFGISLLELKGAIPDADIREGISIKGVEAINADEKIKAFCND